MKRRKKGRRRQESPFFVKSATPGRLQERIAFAAGFFGALGGLGLAVRADFLADRIGIQRTDERRVVALVERAFLRLHLVVDRIDFGLDGIRYQYEL